MNIDRKGPVVTRGMKVERNVTEPERERSDRCQCTLNAGLVDIGRFAPVL